MTLELTLRWIGPPGRRLIQLAKVTYGNDVTNPRPLRICGNCQILGLVFRELGPVAC